MKKRNIGAKIIIVILLIFVFLLFLICMFLLSNKDLITEDGNINIADFQERIKGTDDIVDKEKNPLADDEDVKYNPNQNYDSVKDLLKSFSITTRNLEELDTETHKISVIFPKDLYNEDGTSNQAYFEEVCKRAANYVDYTKFQLYDAYKEITLTVIVDEKTQNIDYKINNVDDFFEKYDLGAYYEAKNTEIVEGESMPIPVGPLRNLFSNGMILTNDLGDSEYSYGRYVYYKNGTVKLITSNARIINMVLLKGYEGEIISEVYQNTKLEDIYEKYPDVAFGSLKDGFLGYRSDDLYYFFYPDEVSIYQYSYGDYYKFDNLLNNYFETRNLDEFATSLQQLWKGYDTYEYNIEDRYFKVTYPTLGINIEIVKNKDVNIDVYSNFNISERMAKFIGEGRVKLHSDLDSIYEYEKKRRLNEPSELNEEYKEYTHVKKTDLVTQDNVNEQREGIETVTID